MKPVGTLIPIVLAAGCVSVVRPLDAPRIGSGAEVAPYAIHEECFALAAGERISYRFTAQRPVSFNIHFHEGNTVILPIDIASTTGESGVFAADRAQAYCLMWEAGAEGSLLDYRVQSLERRE